MKTASKHLINLVFVALGASLSALTHADSTTPATNSAPSAPAPALDFGDYAPATLRMKASAALDAKNYDAAVGYANKCIEAFGSQAESQQAALKSMPSDKDTIFKQWALNDVGVAYLVKGQALEAQGKKKEATDAYKTLVDKLSFAQCWDPQGWFWTPADQAKERLANLASS